MLSIPKTVCWAMTLRTKGSLGPNIYLELIWPSTYITSAVRIITHSMTIHYSNRMSNVVRTFVQRKKLHSVFSKSISTWSSPLRDLLSQSRDTWQNTFFRKKLNDSLGRPCCVSDGRKRNRSFVALHKKVEASTV